MKALKYLSLVCAYLLSVHSVFSQTTYLTEKQGAYSYNSSLNSRGTEYVTFGNNAKTLSDYFYGNIPVMNINKGFDLAVSLTGYADDNYKVHKWNYGLRGELNFDFQLFLKDANGEGKWKVEPPHWSLEINNTEMGGHGGMLNEGGEGSILGQVFMVFPLVKELAPGVRYYDCAARTCGEVVVFNPDRPDYWLPVTVREIVDAKLKYYKENDRMIYDFIKPLIEKMSVTELNSPAFYGSDDAILNVNGIGDGLQLMRFNPEYWDRTLPVSAIQLLTFVYFGYGYNCFNEEDQKNADEEYFKNNGHINYSSEITKSINFKKLAGFFQNR
jgi:hypothetical protein